MEDTADFYIPRHLFYDFLELLSALFNARPRDFDQLWDAIDWLGICDTREITTLLGRKEIVVHWLIVETDLDLFHVRCRAADWVLKEFQKAHVATIFFNEEEMSAPE